MMVNNIEKGIRSLIFLGEKKRKDKKDKAEEKKPEDKLGKEEAETSQANELTNGDLTKAEEEAMKSRYFISILTNK
jgi:DNA-directed RNA polymerase delta subunit